MGERAKVKGERREFREIREFKEFREISENQLDSLGNNLDFSGLGDTLVEGTIKKRYGVVKFT